jgi:hypothetical protein
MRGKGINYDTGFYLGGTSSREDFAPAVVAREMAVIAGDLGCTAVRISAGEPERLSIAGQHAAAAGLEVWFAPFPCELAAGQLVPLFEECADRAERLRRSGGTVVLVTGCELSLFADGFLPGGTIYERLERLGSWGPELQAAFRALPAKLNDCLADTATATRRRSGGPVTYASGMWEPADWQPFDIVAVDAYRDAGNAATFGGLLRQPRGHGKPLVVSEYGCCGYQGAADRGGLGWMIVDTGANPPRLDGDYVRDEAEQVRYLTELNEIFAATGVDLAFWFTFAGYQLVAGPGPRGDLDLASYGVVRMLPGGPPAGPMGLGWEPKLVFGALREFGWSEGNQPPEAGQWVPDRDAGRPGHPAGPASPPQAKRRKT